MTPTIGKDNDARTNRNDPGSDGSGDCVLSEASHKRLTITQHSLRSVRPDGHVVSRGSVR